MMFILLINNHVFYNTDNRSPNASIHSQYPTDDIDTIIEEIEEYERSEEQKRRKERRKRKRVENKRRKGVKESKKKSAIATARKRVGGRFVKTDS